MTPWIQVYTNAPTHQKTYRLAEELKIPIYAALGLMVSLWAWAAVNATGGDITGYPPMAICDAVGWKKGVKFYNALKKVRLIEEVDGKILIRSLGRKEHTADSPFYGIIDDVDVLGFGEKPVWKQTGEGLEIQTREVRSESPVFFRITCR